MSSFRNAALLAATSLCVVVQGLEAAPAATASFACSSNDMQRVQTQVTAIRSLLESDADSSSKATNVPSTCKAALTFDLSAAIEDGEENCANSCITWINDVVDAPTCEDDEMIMYQRRMSVYLTQCNVRKRVKLHETDNDSFEHSNRLRGLAAGHPEGRKPGVNGLMDALLVVTLNNAL